MKRSALLPCPLPISVGFVNIGIPLLLLLFLLQAPLGAERPKSRPDSLRALLAHLGVGDRRPLGAAKVREESTQ